MSERILITGATGMVGSWVLQELIENDSVQEIISVGRRKTGVESVKLKEIVHSNFLDFSTLRNELSNMDVCIHCLGVYQNQVTEDEFFEITCDYQKALTDTLEKTCPNMTFVLFGASGADKTEKSRTRFARAKGRAENYLDSTSFPKKYIFRPGYIHPTGNRKPSGWLYNLMLPLAGLLFKMIPLLGISDRDLAKAMVNVGIKGESESRVFKNHEMKAFV